MKTVWLVGGSLVGMIVLLCATAWVIGRRLPEAHSATVVSEVNATPELVMTRIRDIAHHADWRPDVQRIEILGEEHGVLRYVEHGSNGRIPYAFRELVPGRVFTSTIDTDTLPFGGAWTITVEPLGEAGTRVTIREDGVVRPPLFRTISRYVMGHTHSIDAYLLALRNNLNGSR
jgi:hypothetical protein